MKTTIYFTTLFSLLFVYTIKAQNYSPIVVGNTSVFYASFGDGHTRAIHVDSSTIDSGKESFYFLKTISYEGGGCYSDGYISDWTGPKMLKDGNAYYFFNKDNDSIKILPLKQVGGTWKLYKYADDSYIEATVTAKDWISFLTLTDSVKTISLQMKDASGTNVSSTINSKNIRLSKNYGFIALIDFVNFPNSYDNNEELGSLSNPLVGPQLLTPRKIYNFNVNDEFHYEERRNNISVSTTDDVKRVLHITGKYLSANTDTVKYTISDYSETTTHHYFPTTPDTYSSGSTVYTTTYVFNDSTIYPVSRKFVEDGIRVIKIYTPYVNDTNGRLSEFITSTYVSNDGSGCWQEILDYGSDQLTLVEGVGKLNHDWSAGFASNYEHLVYYKKGSQTWGEPLVLSTYSKKQNAALTLFPNPLKQGEQLHLQTENFQTKQITVYNHLGTKVLDANNASSVIESVDVSLLQPGLYVIQLINANNEFTSGKFIIK